MEHISISILNIPGPFGDGLRQAEARKAAYIAEHGQDAWEKRLADMKHQEQEEHERKTEEQRSRLRLEKSGFYDKETDECVIDKYRFDNFNRIEGFQHDMYDMCQRFIKQGGWLYMSGQNGAGKTHLGTAVCGHFLKAGRSTRYVIFKTLMVELKANVNDDEEYARLLNEYGRADVLYIDDFMKPVRDPETQRAKQPSAADIDHSFTLLNMRYVRNGTTIITSEKSLNEIMGLDEALGSRIKQRCGEFVMNIARKEGRNWRLR